MKYYIKLLVKVHVPVYGVSSLPWVKVPNEEVTLMLHWLYKVRACLSYPGPEVIKHVSCLTQLSLKFQLLINSKMLKKKVS